MAPGHTVTPYSITTTRRHARKNKDVLLLLSSLSDETTVDILDVVEQNITTLPAITSQDRSLSISCERAKRDGDTVGMVLAIETRGEIEIVREIGDRSVAFVKKSDRHLTQYFAGALLWRPPSGTDGVLLTHSPWGRGGRRGAITRLIQQSLNMNSDAKAKIATDALVPDKVIEQYLRSLEATRLIYSKPVGITSTFNQRRASAPGEIELVIRGVEDTKPFRDAVAAALRQRRRRGVESLFRVEVRDDGGGYREEVFDDVSIDIKMPSGGTKRYSLRDDTIPTLGLDATAEITQAYVDMSAQPEGQWADRLLDAVHPRLKGFLRDVTP